jgi:redox-sensitive bicupin YhaK (pirin superfamily)
LLYSPGWCTAQVMRFSSRGALHSERNGSPTEPMRFLQFWILPSDPALESAVQQRQYTVEDRTGRLLQIMGPAGTDGLDLAQNARVLVGRLPQGDQVRHDLGEGRGGYLYVLDGELEAAGDKLGGGDAAKLAGPEPLEPPVKRSTDLRDHPFDHQTTRRGPSGSIWTDEAPT